MGVNSHPGEFPSRRADQVPVITAEAMRAIEKAALEEFGVDVLQLMENTGRAAATLALAMLGGGKGRRVTVLAGRGSIGGAGLAAVRHLANAGVLAEPVLGFVNEDETPPSVRRQLHILQKSGIVEPYDRESSRATLEEHLAHADLVIDALVGYGVTGPLPGICAAIVEEVTSSPAPVLALDGPSGFDCSSGETWSPHISATTTLSLDLPKKAMVDRANRKTIGELYVADIGIPARAHQRAGVSYNGLYSDGPIVRLR